VRHERHYTLEEARALLPWASDLIASMRDAQARLSDSETREALAGASKGNGGGTHGRTVGEAFVALQNGIAAFAEREIVLRDLARGLIDFPALRDGAEVYLCWVHGEADIDFWHGVDAGFAGRQPL
jgi:hypothetical protein